FQRTQTEFQPIAYRDGMDGRWRAGCAGTGGRVCSSHASRGDNSSRGDTTCGHARGERSNFRCGFGAAVGPAGPGEVDGGHAGGQGIQVWPAYRWIARAIQLHVAEGTDCERIRVEAVPGFGPGLAERDGRAAIRNRGEYA